MTSATLLIVPVFSDLGRLALSLRQQVDVVEQGYDPADEFDQHDFTATHIVATVEGTVAGTRA